MIKPNALPLKHVATWPGKTHTYTLYTVVLTVICQINLDWTVDNLNFFLYLKKIVGDTGNQITGNFTGQMPFPIQQM